MENSSNTVTKWAMTYGLYLGVFHIIFIVIMYFTGHFFNSGYYGYISTAFVVGLTWQGLVKYRDEVSGGYIKYGKALGLGVLISVFAAIFAGATMYIIMKFDGSLSDEMLGMMVEEIERSGLSGEMVENVEKMYEVMVTPGVVALSAYINKVVGGTIISLIVAAFVKKNPESGFYDAVKDVE
jgi:membrane-bound ClpP family serine protease